MAPKTHWTNVGYSAAKRGLSFDAVKLPGEGRLANEWIREGFEKWLRKATHHGATPKDGRQ